MRETVGRRYTVHRVRETVRETVGRRYTGHRVRETVREREWGEDIQSIE